MVILDARDPELEPHNIFDCFGAKLERVVWANTVTGEVEVISLNERGLVEPPVRRRLRVVRWKIPGGIRAVKIEDPPN